jgi:hypothetical protein
VGTIPDARDRATLLSVDSILGRAGCAWVASRIGGFLEAGKLDLFLALSALGTMGGMAVLFVGMRYVPAGAAEESSWL